MLVAFSIGFGALFFHLQRMLSGEPRASQGGIKLRASEAGAMCVCGVCLLVFGLYIPPAFTSMLHNAMAVLQ
jgi:hypothetical protein